MGLPSCRTGRYSILRKERTMSDEVEVARLAALFKQTGEAHHQAFLQTDGEDPEWPIWYAEYLQDRLRPFLAAPLTRSRLVFCLIGADDEHRATESDTPWPEYYARRFLECLGPAEEPAKDPLVPLLFRRLPVLRSRAPRDRCARPRCRAPQHLRRCRPSRGAA